jgi:DnaJ-class molecular chaperone
MDSAKAEWKKLYSEARFEQLFNEVMRVNAKDDLCPSCDGRGNMGYKSIFADGVEKPYAKSIHCKTCGGYGYVIRTVRD